MRYTVVTTPQNESRHGLTTLTFENKRELTKWMSEVGLDVNENPGRAGRCIHQGADEEEYVIFKGNPEALRVARTVGV